MEASTPLVDIHAHVYPRVMVDRYKLRAEMPRITGERGEERFIMFPAEENDEKKGRVMPERFWDLDERLQFMDKMGITHSVVSVGNPWLSQFDDADAPQVARSINELLASYETTTNGRVVSLGVLPEESVKSLLTEVDWLREQSGIRGVVIGTRLLGRPLDDEILFPFWKAVSDGGFAVFIHPHFGLGLEEMDGYGRSIGGALGFTFETTLALVRLALAGIFQKFPDLVVVAAHGGGTLPFLAGRLDAGFASDLASHKIIDVPPGEYLSRIYADALVFQERSLHTTIDYFGVDKVMFGTDYPFRIDPTLNVVALEALDAPQREAVGYKNATKLFRLSA